MILTSFEAMLFIAGLVATLGILYVFTFRHEQSEIDDVSSGAPADGDVFLFHDNRLIDTNAEDAPDALTDFVSEHAQSHPGLGATLRKLTDGQTSEAKHSKDLKISQQGNITRITLPSHTTAVSASITELVGDSPIQFAIENAPVAAWQTDDRGVFLFGNAAYRELTNASASEAPFTPDDISKLENRGKRRLPLRVSEHIEESWHDVTRVDAPDGSIVFFAVDVSEAIAAEAGQRKFVQTLTKTFAHLSTGLAIFDRSRKLALFNPALMDLTHLPIDVLSKRPSLETFFDYLRDRQIMPEPRDYRSWRDQFSDMLNKAKDGEYCETWTLPSGLTYRVSGKPHPDGAVAFLFEDISAELSLTRRFRAELELSQSVLEAMDCAIAVFSRSGTLTFTNAQFREMWRCDPDNSFIEMSILDVARLWHEQGAPSPVWGDLRDFVITQEERTEWSDTVIHSTIGAQRMDAAPLAGGATLIRFTSTGSPSQPSPANADTSKANSPA